MRPFICKLVLQASILRQHRYMNKSTSAAAKQQQTRTSSRLSSVPDGSEKKAPTEPAADPTSAAFVDEVTNKVADNLGDVIQTKLLAVLQSAGVVPAAPVAGRAPAPAGAPPTPPPGSPLGGFPAGPPPTSPAVARPGAAAGGPPPLGGFSGFGSPPPPAAGRPAAAPQPFGVPVVNAPQAQQYAAALGGAGIAGYGFPGLAPQLPVGLVADSIPQYRIPSTEFRHTIVRSILIRKPIASGQ